MSPTFMRDGVTAYGDLMDIKHINFRKIQLADNPTSFFQDNVDQALNQATLNDQKISEAVQDFTDTFSIKTNWTPSGTWTSNATYTGFYERVRNIGLFSVYIALSGAPTAAVLNINLPTGLTIDTAYLLGTDAGMMFKSAVTLKDTSASFWQVGGVSYASTTTVEIDVFSTPTLYLRLTGVTNLIPFTFANTDWIKIDFEVPILEWR